MSADDKENTAGHATVRRGEAAERYRAREEEMADAPTDLDKEDWKAVLKRTIFEFGQDKGLDLAAALTYYAVLSLFPALLALSSLLGLFGQASTTQALLDVVERLGATEQQLQPIKSFLESTQEGGGAGLAFVIGLAGALWAASNYVNAFSRAMNAVYEVEEGRPFWKLRPQMLALTVVLLVLVVVVALALAATGPLAEAIGGVIGLGDTALAVWNIAKWPVIVAIVVLIVALLYWGTPNVQQPVRWISPGALVAIVVWVLATAIFGFYVANFGSYNATYGALAGVVVMLLWLWLTNISLVFGAEFDAEMQRGRELEGGLPAEEMIQLPPRDTSKSQKQAEKEADLVAQSRRLRMESNSDDTKS